MVQGSSDFLQTLWRNNLVDEFTVLLFRLVLGRGKRLFVDGAAPVALKRVQEKTYPTVVIVARYLPDGAVRTGDFPRVESSNPNANGVAIRSEEI